MKKIKPSARDVIVSFAELALTGFLFWKQLRINKVARFAGHSGIANERTLSAEIMKNNAAAIEQGRRQNPSHASVREPFWKAIWHVAVSAAKAWSTHRAASKGAALALYMLFSLAPMLLLVVTIAGFFFGEDAVRTSLIEQMSGLVGTQGAQAIKVILAGSQQQHNGIVAGIVSAVLVLVSATSAFAELKDSLDELWEVPPSAKSGIWNFVRERFLSIGLILVLAFMLLVSLAVSAALAALGNLWNGGEADSPFRIISLVISNAFSFAILTGLFAVIFKYLPAVKVAWKDVIVGAILTAVLFIIGKSLIGTYIAHGHISSAYGAAGSLVILITWIYYSAQIFFYGSLFTHEFALKVGSRSVNTVSDAASHRSSTQTSHESAEPART
jgi:membrane protein